ncbi:hypothetical protein [Conexibacter sp. S30A1]|uniref:hypothetical protein n=1 Tax=Conexibacter sp. S30A1 TaxID=2937800 RepID=UPI00200C8EFD|nr:hypothetical protein [Conexibacter sp. S30A1]
MGLERFLADYIDSALYVCQNVRVEIRWARSATKHRVSRARSEHAIRNAVAIIDQPAPADSASRDDRIVFLGPDRDGTMLEVMAVETEAGLLVIHAMLIRRKYLDHLEGATDEQQ